MRFTAATWNLRYDVPARRQRKRLRSLRRRRVSLLLLQEFQADGIHALLREEGWSFHRDGSQAVAWWPGRWVALSRDVVPLTDRGYPRVGGAHAMPTMPVVRLEDRRSGRTLDVGCYHTAPSVQRAGVPNPHSPRRVESTRDAAAAWAAFAAGSDADAVLIGGDDNVDESRGPGWRFMRWAATGLRQVQAPRGTHGSRKIDDFRVRGLRVGRGWTLATPGDHRAHVRRFRWHG